MPRCLELPDGFTPEEIEAKRVEIDEALKLVGDYYRFLPLHTAIAVSSVLHLALLKEDVDTYHDRTFGKHSVLDHLFSMWFRFYSEVPPFPPTTWH